MHQLMMPISMPENAHIFYSRIIKLLTFDPFPNTDGFYEKNLKLEKGDPYMEKAAEVGYESRLFSFNSGSVLIFGLLMVAI